MANTKFITGMRDDFFNALFEIFKKDEKMIFVTADNGAPSLDQFELEFPDRFYNVGIAEQQMIGMAAGLAFEGKKVYTYAIAPFVSLRCYEQNKLDLCSMNLPVVNIGVGAGYAYDIMGATHHTVEDVTIMRALPNLVIFSPADGVTSAALAKISRELDSPQYIRFDRTGIPDIYTGKDINFHDGIIKTKEGRNGYIIANGVMVHQALAVSSELEKKGLDIGVIDLFRLKPINEDLLLDWIRNTKNVITLEEHLLAGGMGSAIAEIFVDKSVGKPLLRLGQNDKFVFDNGGREVIWEKYGLDVKTLTEKIGNWISK